MHQRTRRAASLQRTVTTAAIALLVGEAFAVGITATSSTGATPRATDRPTLLVRSSGRISPAIDDGGPSEAAAGCPSGDPGRPVEGDRPFLAETSGPTSCSTENEDGAPGPSVVPATTRRAAEGDPVRLWRRIRVTAPGRDPAAVLRTIIEECDGVERSVVEMLAEEEGIDRQTVGTTLERLRRTGALRAERGADGEEVLAWSNARVGA